MSEKSVLLSLLLGVLLVLTVVHQAHGGITRTYYLSIEEATWDYAPLKMDGATGVMFKDAGMGGMSGMGGMDHAMTYDASYYALRTSTKIGTKYIKARYYRYTDATFTTKWPEASRWTHLGILGPIIYCEVGDVVQVVLKNSARYDYSIHVHGLYYEKTSEGMMDEMGETMAKGVVSPGEQYTYTYQVPERSGPGPNDPSSVVWLYHSHVDSVTDTNSGLIGAIVVGRAGTLAGPVDDPYVNGITHEFVTLFNVFEESSSHYIEANVKRTFKKDAKKIDLHNADFMESNKKYSINGYIYNNLPGLAANSGDTVRWYLVALGQDIHTAHWHGQTLLAAGLRVDVESILPAQSKVLDMVPDSKGDWIYHCHVDHHIHAGMSALFNVM